MAKVTIEGTVMASDRLGYKQRATVELTDYVRKLVKIGAVIIVDYDDGGLVPAPQEVVNTAGTDTVPPPLPEQTWSPGDDPILPEVPESAHGPDSVPLEPLKPAHDPNGPKPPPKNASSIEWKAWVDANVPDADSVGKSRDQLIAIWQEHDGE